MAVVALLLTSFVATEGAASRAALAAGSNGAVIDSISPVVTSNSGDTSVSVSGMGFNPLTDQILLAPRFTSAYSPKATPGVFATTDVASSSFSRLVGTLASANAAPGAYDVYTYRSGTGELSDPGCGNTKTPCVFTITSSGRPAVATTRPGTRNGDNLDIVGQHLAAASTVSFLNSDGLTADPKLSFVVDGQGANPTTFAGYTSSQLLQGKYTATTPFTAGRHYLRVTNTAGENSELTEFWQPYFSGGSSITPSSAGQGAASRVVTVHGQGFRPGATLTIESVNVSNNPLATQDDLTTGPATVSGDGTSISAAVNVDPAADTSKVRGVTVTNPDGGTWRVNNLLTIAPAPSVTSLDTSALGQGASYIETISGSNFASGSTTATTPTFAVSGDGVTARTISSTNSSAEVLFAVASDAATGNRTLTVTNPDGGTQSVAPDAVTGSSAFTVDPGPTVSAVSPGGTTASSSKVVTVKGTNFDAPSTPLSSDPVPTVRFDVPDATGAAPSTLDPALTASSVSVSKGAQGAADTLTMTVTASSSAQPGLRNLVVTNTGDHGTVSCAGCFGIDTLSTSPTSSVDNAPATIRFTASSAIPTGTSVRLVKAGDPSVQADIVGGGITTAGSSISASFDLTDAATGSYSAVATPPSGPPLSCASCFTVTGPKPTISAITPNNGGQGARNRVARITGTNFSHGMKVTIKGLRVHGVTFLSRTQLELQIDIPSDAPTGDATLIVNNNDASQASDSASYTVNAGPGLSSVAPTSLGQGADGVKITVSGPHYQQGTVSSPTTTVDLGAGVTGVSVSVTDNTALVPGVTPEPDDTLSATVRISPDATASTRDVTVTNPDGGTSTLVQGFTINPGPKVTAISPNHLPPGGVGNVTITGTDFSMSSTRAATPSLSDVTLTDITVLSTTTITARAAAATGVAKGPRDVVVLNPTDSGRGICTGCFYIATPPSPTRALQVVSTTSASLTVRWSAPTDNGGAPLTGFAVIAHDGTGTTRGTTPTVAASATTATVSGLDASTTYTLSVTAANVAGDSTPSTISATTSPPQPPSTLTVRTASAPTISGSPVILSGRLTTQSGSNPIAGASIEIAIAPDSGPSLYPRATTEADGTWRYTFRPTYNVTIKTLYRGDSTHGQAFTTAFRHAVSTRVTVRTPKNGAVSSSRSPLTVRGSTSPSKSGSTVTLYRWNGRSYVAVLATRLASDGSYAFAYDLSRGDYTLKVGIGRTHGNFTGYSAGIAVHRR